MKFWVGITDDDWFEQLSLLKPDEVNFWQPGATIPCRMEPGTPFLFKLHHPRNFVVGGGFFVRFSVLPIFLAWEAFAQKNGVQTLRDLVQAIGRRKKPPGATPNTDIGCNLLNEPFFFPEEDWIPIPENWELAGTQRGKRYFTDDVYGAALWEKVSERLARYASGAATAAQDEEPRLGNEYLIRARIGQGIFRSAVTAAYQKRCAVTGAKALPALEAAHIKPFGENGPNLVANGILLRADVHRLFDRGYVTIDPALIFLVSSRVKEDFKNGKEYYKLHGFRLQNPARLPKDNPSPEFIAWHNNNRFEKFWSDET